MIINNKGLNASQLKLIAFVTMVIDHIGYIIYTDIMILRYIGRISFPIYAFLVGEGLFYSRNRKRYFIKMVITFIVFQIVSFFVEDSFNVCALYGFLSAIAIVGIYKWAKEDIIKRRPIATIPISIIFVSTVLFASAYMFFAILLPLIVYFVRDKKRQMCLFGITLILCGLVYWNYQILALFALVPLLLYNGEKGKTVLFKNSFYILYPLHYLIIGIIKFMF